MYKSSEILAIARKEPFLLQELELLHREDKKVPGSVTYSIRRFRKHPGWNMEDLGMINYHVEKNDPSQNSFELRFCVTGNVYCKEKHIECNQCKLNASGHCQEKVDSMDVLSFTFSPNYLRQFSLSEKKNRNFSNEVLNFNHDISFSKTLPVCSKTRLAIEAMLNNQYTGHFENIFVNAQMQILLLYSIECMLKEHHEAGFECKFLANEADREKIFRAREILLQHIGEPITIKALSRKVAINECYLKKGFKEIFGTTIFDFYQGQRMEHAKYLLDEKGLSVTEVSLQLGYSSISHFSTAFKKHTGLKPCELLLRA